MVSNSETLEAVQDLRRNYTNEKLHILWEQYLDEDQRRYYQDLFTSIKNGLRETISNACSKIESSKVINDDEDKARILHDLQNEKSLTMNLLVSINDYLHEQYDYQSFESTLEQVKSIVDQFCHRLSNELEKYL